MIRKAITLMIFGVVLMIGGSFTIHWHYRLLKRKESMRNEAIEERDIIEAQYIKINNNQEKQLKPLDLQYNATMSKINQLEKIIDDSQSVSSIDYLKDFAILSIGPMILGAGIIIVICGYIWIIVINEKFEILREKVKRSSQHANMIISDLQEKHCCKSEEKKDHGGRKPKLRCNLTEIEAQSYNDIYEKREPSSLLGRRR